MSDVHLTHLEQLTKPQIEPLSLGMVTDWVHSTNAEEERMRMLLQMCRGVLENRLGVAFLTQQMRATFEFQPDNEELVPLTWDYNEMVATLPRPPLQSIDEVAVEVDIDVFEAINEDAYDLVRQFPSQIFFYGDAFGNVEFPWWFNLNRTPRVQVTYMCGWETAEDVPEEYKLLLLKFIADTYVQAEGSGISPELGSMLFASKVLVL